MVQRKGKTMICSHLCLSLSHNFICPLLFSFSAKPLLSMCHWQLGSKWLRKWKQTRDLSHFSLAAIKETIKVSKVLSWENENEKLKWVMEHCWNTSSQFILSSTLHCHRLHLSLSSTFWSTLLLRFGSQQQHSSKFIYREKRRWKWKGRPSALRPVGNWTTGIFSISGTPDNLLHLGLLSHWTVDDADVADMDSRSRLNFISL